MLWRRNNKAEATPTKLLAWTAVACAFFALLGVGELMEDMLRATRNSFHTHKASGDIVLVKIDDASVHKVGRWPWPRRYHADLTDRLTAAGAKRIFFDILIESESSAEDDRRLADAFVRSGRVTMPVRTHASEDDARASGLLPMLAGKTGLATISVDYNYQNAAWKLPYAGLLGDREVPSLAADLAGQKGAPGKQFPIDYSINPHSITAIPAASVLDGSADSRLFAGKDVVVGTASEAIGDQFFFPGEGRIAGAYLHILGAETLKSGHPKDLGWLPAAILALGIAGIALWRKSAAAQNVTLASGAASLLVVPGLLELKLIFIEVVPALFGLIAVASVLALRRFRQRGLVNSVSGLPNLSALRANREGREWTLVGAKVINYAEIVSALPADEERQLIDQIVARLSAGASGRTFYQGDGGIFAWFEESRAGVAHHIEALSSLFRTPVRIGSLNVDLMVSFGVDIGSSRSVTNRLGSALVAAEEAAHEGLKWKYYDPEALRDASWRLSMLSQLDAAIDKGEVWVAYQPKVDLATRRIVGAEALARWTHPEKGPIAASEFVAAAEQHDRIAKLTLFVLEKAIAAAAAVNRRGFQFDIAVNLSGRLLGDKSLTGTISRLLETHGLEARHLTLELTETAALGGTGEALELLAALKETGVHISIDDYGTGLSTLDYLKKIPAAEIKIDQSFVRGMCDNRSDRLMVQSTIALAHSLGRTVVAEGVEQASVLNLLAEMKCDFAQGFITGRPSSIETLVKRLASDQRREVA